MSAPSNTSRSAIAFSPVLGCAQRAELTTQARLVITTRHYDSLLRFQNEAPKTSRLSHRGPCQGQLFSGDAPHDLGLPDWDSTKTLHPRRRTCKEWFQSANFLRRTYRREWPTHACESKLYACRRRLSGVQAKLLLVIKHCSVSWFCARCSTDMPTTARASREALLKEH